MRQRLPLCYNDAFSSCLRVTIITYVETDESRHHLLRTDRVRRVQSRRDGGQQLDIRHSQLCVFGQLDVAPAVQARARVRDEVASRRVLTVQPA